MRRKRQNAITLLSPPLSDSQICNHKQREFLSTVSIFCPLLYFKDRMFFSLFLSLHEISLTTVCVTEQGILLLFTFLMKFLYLKGFFFFSLGHFFSLSLHARAVEIWKNWVKALANLLSLWMQSSLLSQSCIFHVSFSMLDLCFNSSKSSLVSLPTLKQNASIATFVNIPGLPWQAVSGLDTISLWTVYTLLG